MPKNDTIFKRLEQATEAERVVICNTLGLDKKYVNDMDKISKKFRSVSGHTIANTFRDVYALEYISILRDTYNGINSFGEKKLKDGYSPKNFDMIKATEEELESEISTLTKTIYQNLKKNNPKKTHEYFLKEIKDCGKNSSGVESVLGGGVVGILSRLISLPVAGGVTVTQILSTPTYRKTFVVVLQLIQIKNRFEVEQKLKDKS